MLIQLQKLHHQKFHQTVTLRIQVLSEKIRQLSMHKSIIMSYERKANLGKQQYKSKGKNDKDKSFRKSF